jgi:hypothetical protein
MAFSYTMSSGGTLIIPDSAVNINVQASTSSNATSGVVVLVGEAEEGPSWNQDQALGNKLASNFYGPQDLARVQAKYGSGRLVDAFSGAIAPSASPRITGAPNQVILVKTNNSTAASLTTADGHGTATAKRGGTSGNLLQMSVSTAIAESAPSTGNFSYVPSSSSASLSARINGGASEVLAISANTSPSSLASAITGMAGLNAVGGVDRGILAGLSGVQIQLQVTSTPTVAISLASPSIFSALPQAGDTINIPTGSVLAGTGNANVGWYLVLSSSNVAGAASISAIKIGGAPVAVAPAAISGTPANDLVNYSPIQINNMTGADRNILSGLVGQNMAVSVIGSSLTASLVSGKFAGLPTVGDIVHIPAGSAFAGIGSANVGWYQVTLVSNISGSASIQMARLSNGLPVAVSSVAIAAVTDMQCLDPQIKGVGKTLEIVDNAGAVNIGTMMLNLGSVSAASWISTQINSSAELNKVITIQRSSTNTIETFSVGGNVALNIGYRGTTGTATISSTGLTTSVVGGAGANLSLSFSQFPTLATLVAAINSNPGYSAALGSNLDGQRSCSVLGQCTVGICSGIGNLPGRVKRDLWDMTQGNTGLINSALISYAAAAVAGLPVDSSATYLGNGAKGGTTGLQLSQAIDALQGIRCNFVIPLISQDASVDAASGLTDASSTYTVDACNAAVKSHCLAMSTPKIKRHRVGLVSKRGTFAQAKASAQSMASFRIAHLFQDVIDINSQGALQQFQPWYGAAKAAGMQAAGSYKSIFNKTVNISGAKQAAGDFDDGNLSQVEDALNSGLIPIQQQQTGGYTFVSDQMTYSLDNNFVYNSLQAVYVADLMAIDLAASLKNAFVGESVADVTPGAVESFIKSKMAEYLRRKFTVATASAPGGWKSIGINITPGVLQVSVIAVEATSIYFIPIDLNIEGIQSSSTIPAT